MYIKYDTREKHIFMGNNLWCILIYMLSAKQVPAVIICFQTNTLYM